MKKTRAVSLLLCLAFALTLSGCARRTPPAETVPCVTLGSARSVYLYDMETEAPVSACESGTQVPMGKLARLFTAYLALENLDPQEMITNETVGRDDIPVGIFHQNIQKGETLTVRDLAACTITGYAADSAMILADCTAGSREAFVEQLNSWAADLGCTGTRFTDPYGLDGENAQTTAKDLVTMLTAALKNETFRELFQTECYEVPATNCSEARELVTLNHMMSQRVIPDFYDERVTGGVQSVSAEAGASLICTVQDRYIAIVLGAERVFAENGWQVAFFGNFEEMANLLSQCLGE